MKLKLRERENINRTILLINFVNGKILYLYHSTADRASVCCGKNNTVLTPYSSGRKKIKGSTGNEGGKDSAREEKMDQILNKVGSYWFNKKANKQFSSVGEDISVSKQAFSNDFLSAFIFRHTLEVDLV